MHPAVVGPNEVVIWNEGAAGDRDRTLALNRQNLRNMSGLGRRRTQWLIRPVIAMHTLEFPARMLFSWLRNNIEHPSFISSMRGCLC